MYNKEKADEVIAMQKKHIELKKMTKKAQREHHARQRGNWGDISPITKVIPSRKVYKRARDKKVELAE